MRNPHTRGSLLLVMFLSAASAATVHAQPAADATPPDGTTPLHWAAYREDVETARSLLRAGANVNAQNRYGVTPLAVAATNGNPEVISLLLSAGANANTPLPDGQTPLMAAARSGSAAAVRLLLEAGSDVNAREPYRAQTALMWAAAEDHVEVLKMLLKHGADIHARSSAVFVPAEAQFRQNEEQHGGFTALLFAAREGRIGAVQTLLAAGANINDSLLVLKNKDAKPESGLNAFLLAVENAHYELAALLLDVGADPNMAPFGWTALHQLSWVRKVDDAGHAALPPEGSGNMTAFEFARKLVKRGANVNARATSKRAPAGGGSLNMLQATPFLMAARTKDAAYMRLLVELGADSRLPNADNTTPLMAAAGIGMNSLDDGETERQLLESVSVAIEFGNDLNAVDNNGETAMHGAAYKLVPALVKLLAEKGAKVEVWNKPNNKGATPLEIAMKTKSNRSASDSPRTVAAIRELLIQAGVVAPGQ